LRSFVAKRKNEQGGFCGKQRCFARSADGFTGRPLATSRLKRNLSCASIWRNFSRCSCGRHFQALATVAWRSLRPFTPLPRPVALQICGRCSLLKKMNARRAAFAYFMTDVLPDWDMIAGIS